MSDRIQHSDPISIPANHHRNRSASFSSDDDDNNSPPLQTPSYQGPVPRVANAQSPSTSPILSYFFHSPSKSLPSGLPPSPTTTFGTLGRGFSAKAPQEKPILEEDEDRGYVNETPLMRHARRMSTSATWAIPPRPSFNPTMPTNEQSERGAGLLRRLSLGSALVRVSPLPHPFCILRILFNSICSAVLTQSSSQPQVSPPHPTTALAPAAPVEAPRALATSSDSASPGRRKQRRASTLGVPGENVSRAHRPPSPMGERILKGHFDGFN